MAVLFTGTLWGEAADQETLDRIQEECLHAYTPEMLAELYGEEELPEEARESSEAAVEHMVDVIQGEKGRFYPFLLEDLQEAFELYVKPGTRFLDLGSGDGRVVFYAAALGADATGIEYDPEVFAVSERARDALVEGDVLDADKVHLERDDFFNHSWSDWDVIFYFDLSSFEQHRLRKKLFSELDAGTRLIVGHQRVRFPGLELETRFDSIHVYRQPEFVGDYDPKFSKYGAEAILDAYALREGWYNGSIPNAEENLAPFTDALSYSFRIVEPDGQIRDRSSALAALRKNHGSWRGEEGSTGSLQIRNVALRFIVDSVATFVFEEHHAVDGKTRKFRTTAVLQLRHGMPNNVQWLHVHRSNLR